MKISPRQHYQTNLRHLIDRQYRWADISLVTRLVTITTTTIICTEVTPDVVAEWAQRYSKFVTHMGKARVGQSRRLLLTPLQRKLLTDTRPVLEVTGNNRIHLHVMCWEVEAGSVFQSNDPSVREKLEKALHTYLNLANIDFGQAQPLLQVVDGEPRFHRLGQSHVIRSCRYKSGSTSWPLYPDPVEPTGRELRKSRMIDQRLTSSSKGNSLLYCAKKANMGNCVLIAHLDDCSQQVTVEGSRLRPPYRRNPVLIRMIHELNLEGRTFDFADPEFCSMFDPHGSLAKGWAQVTTGRPLFDPYAWVDRGEVFATLYENRGSQRSLIPIRRQLEAMDEQLFAWTHESAEFLSVAIYWDLGIPLMSKFRN